MKVFYKKRNLTEINSVEELQNFLIEYKIFKHFKKFNQNNIVDVENNINTTELISFKQIKPWLKNILNYPTSMYNPIFLRCMGWDENEITEYITERQKINSNKLRIKKQRYPELYFSSTTTRIEYWLSKGYSEDEAKIKLSNRQTTFSKQICIEKYGELEGLKVFNSRQENWIKSLSNNPNYKLISKNNYDYSKKNYDTIISFTSFLDKTKEIILKNINTDNIETFVENVLRFIDVKRFSDIQPYINSVILQSKFKKTRSEIKNIFFEKTFYTLKNQTYGVAIYHNGIRFKSIKEYNIALHLESKNINYIYENYYPESQFKYDFFLPEKNVYIEYYGMLDRKNENNLSKIQTKYREKMLLKNSFCKEKNLSLLSDTDYDNLIKKINEII
jgi:hypothetical protein